MPRFDTTILFLLPFALIACGGGDPNMSDDNLGVDAGPDLSDASAAATVTELVEGYVDPNGSPGKAVGMVVGIATPQGRMIYGFGATEIGGDVAPDEHSLFDIASVTKVYTGYLLARGLINEEVTTAQTLEETYGSEVPIYEGLSISLMDLATHTSALPNYPDNMVGTPPTPAAGYTRDMLQAFLASHELVRAPGERYEYSNVGSGILGDVLVNAAGLSSFDELVQREIAAPYGLDDTTANPNPDQAERKVQGHAMGMPTVASDIGAPLQGGGILKASADDVLAFIEGAIGGTDPAWNEVMTPLRASPNGENAMTGLMLNIEQPVEGPAVYSKDGGAPGFSIQIRFTLEPPVAVVILSNVQWPVGTARARPSGDGGSAALGRAVSSTSLILVPAFLKVTTQYNRRGPW